MQAQGGAVGRQRHVDTQGGEAFHQLGQVRPHQGFPSGQPDALEAEALHANLGKALDLFEAEDLRTGQPRHALRRHAVLAAEIAPIGDRDAQIAHDSAERIDKIRRSCLSQSPR